MVEWSDCWLDTKARVSPFHKMLDPRNYLGYQDHSWLRGHNSKQIKCSDLLELRGFRPKLRWALVMLDDGRSYRNRLHICQDPGRPPSYI